MNQITISSLEDAKAEGNAEFQRGNLDNAIEKYQAAIRNITYLQKPTTKKNEVIVLEATLVANVAMCRLKQCELKCNAPTLQLLFGVIQDITSVCNDLDKLTTSETNALRSKLLYRRSKSRHTLAMNHTMLQATSIGNTELIQLCAGAQTDLQCLLSFDSTNKTAKALLQRLKVDAMTMIKENGISSSSSPLGSALNNLLDISNANESNSVENSKIILQSLKFVHASILDDVTNAAHELLKEDMRGGKILVDIGFGQHALFLGIDDKDELHVLALQCIASSCASPEFTALLITILNVNFGGEFEKKLFGIVSSRSYSPNFINVALSLQIRLILHSHVIEDDRNYNLDGTDLKRGRDTLVNRDNQACICAAALKSRCEQCRLMGLNLLSAWLEENPLNIMNAGDRDDNWIAYTKVKEPLEDQVRQMAARDLSEYRKRSAQRNSWRIERSRKNAIQFCVSGGLSALVSSAVKSNQSFWRRECTLSAGRLMNYVRDDTTNLFGDEFTKNILTEFFAEREHRLTIEEVGTEDTETTNGDVELIGCMKRCLFATSLLLANGEMGAWTVKEIWISARIEWEYIVSSKNYAAMSVASEFASAAAGQKEIRPWISSCVDTTSADGAWRTLLSCDDREVRSGMASVMAKLGLADKSVSSNESELVALLEVAVGLLEEDEEKDSFAKDASVGTYHAPTERGVELLSYLSTKTLVKDEIAHNYRGAGCESLCILEKLGNLADPKSKVSAAIKFSLANIFASLAVTIDTLHREAFEGKEITPEQYDDLQAMGKTAEERKMEKFKGDTDTPDALASRINVMANHNIPRALVNLLQDASDPTSEQILIALSRMACEQGVRGSMIQQGCLSACIKMVKHGALSNVQKKIGRLSQHTIAKILVTTNPSLLNTTQCMGSIQPLLLIVRDHDSSDFQKFEALLSITNLASFNLSTKQHIVAENGIPILSYAMFNNHEMIRQSATEVLSNLIPHPKMIEHLRNYEKLKIWVAFSSDFEDNFKCARAALGCLAMATQDQQIADALLRLENTVSMIKAVLESGNLELMHRILVITINMIEHGGDCKDVVASTGTLAFCEAYVNMYQNGQKMEELEFSDEDLKFLGKTIDLAKEIVLAYGK